MRFRARPIPHLPRFQPPRRAQVLACALLAISALACAETGDPAVELGADEVEAGEIDAAPATATDDLRPDDAETRAVARILGREGTEVAGTVELSASPAGDEVTIRVELSGVEPGPHGFHLHEVGDCSAPDFTSAGGHFNPEGNPHGAPDDAAHHAGDLGNVVADASGRVDTVITSRDLSLGDAAIHSAVGKAIIVHEGQDDLVSQPTGDAGGRVGCGVVEIGELVGPS